MIVSREKVMIVFEEVDVKVDGAAEESREVGDLSYVVDYLGKLYVDLHKRNVSVMSPNKKVLTWPSSACLNSHIFGIHFRLILKVHERQYLFLCFPKNFPTPKLTCD